MELVGRLLKSLCRESWSHHRQRHQAELEAYQPILDFPPFVETV